MKDIIIGILALIGIMALYAWYKKNQSAIAANTIQQNAALALATGTNTATNMVSDLNVTAASATDTSSPLIHIMTAKTGTGLGILKNTTTAMLAATRSAAAGNGSTLTGDNTSAVSVPANITVKAIAAGSGSALNMNQTGVSNSKPNVESAGAGVSSSIYKIAPASSGNHKIVRVA